METKNYLVEEAKLKADYYSRFGSPNKAKTASYADKEARTASRAVVIFFVTVFVIAAIADYIW